MNSNKNPLHSPIQNGGLCAIFRTIGCVGDSLSSGEHESMINGKKGYHDLYEYSWGQFIARATGATVYNFSAGGMSAASFQGNKGRLGFLDPDKKCQAYIIALGVNDAIQKVPTGSIADINPENPELNNPETYAGRMGKIISEIKSLQPKARIFLVTSPRMGSPTWDRQIFYDEQQKLLHDMAQLFEFTYVIDLREHVTNEETLYWKNGWVGSHLNAIGYLITANWIMSYIDYIIRENPADFSQVAFIGTDYYNENYKW